MMYPRTKNAPKEFPKMDKNRGRLLDALKLANTEEELTDERNQREWAKIGFGVFHGIKLLDRSPFIKDMIKIMNPDPSGLPHSSIFPHAYQEILLGGSEGRKTISRKCKIENTILGVLKWVKDPKVVALEYIEFEELVEVLTQRAHEKLRETITREGKWTKRDVKKESLAYFVMLIECGQYDGSIFNYHKFRIGELKDDYVSEETFFNYLYETLYTRIKLSRRLCDAKYELIKFMRFLAQTHITSDIFAKFRVHEFRKKQIHRIRRELHKDANNPTAIAANVEWRKMKSKKFKAAVVIQSLLRSQWRRRMYGTRFIQLIQKEGKSRKKQWLCFALEQWEILSANVRQARIREENKLWHDSRSRRTGKQQKGRWNPFPHWHLREIFRVLSPHREEMNYKQFVRFVRSSPLTHRTRKFVGRLWTEAFQFSGSLEPNEKTYRMDKDGFATVINGLLDEAYECLDGTNEGLGLEEVDMLARLLRGHLDDAHELEASKIAREMYNKLDRNGDGVVSLNEFTGFWLWVWQCEMKQGSTHMLRDYMALLACICCEESIVKSMQRSLYRRARVTQGDFAVIRHDQLFGQMPERSYSLLSHNQEPGIVRIERKPAIGNGSHDKKKKKKLYSLPGMRVKKAFTMSEVFQHGGEGGGSRFPHISHLYGGLSGTYSGRIGQVSTEARMREVKWDQKFHLIKSRSNDVRPTNLKMYFEDHRRSMTRSLPTLYHAVATNSPTSSMAENINSCEEEEVSPKLIVQKRSQKMQKSIASVYGLGGRRKNRRLKSSSPGRTARAVKSGRRRDYEPRSAGERESSKEGKRRMRFHRKRASPRNC